MKQMWEYIADDELSEELTRRLLQVHGISYEFDHRDGIIRWWVNGAKVELFPKRFQRFGFTEYPVYDLKQVATLVPFV